MASCCKVEKDKNAKVIFPGDSTDNLDEAETRPTPSARLAFAMRKEIMEGIKESIDSWMEAALASQQAHLDELFESMRGQSADHYQRQEQSLQDIIQTLHKHIDTAPRKSHMQKHEDLLKSMAQEEKNIAEMLAAQQAAQQEAARQAAEKALQEAAETKKGSKGVADRLGMNKKKKIKRNSETQSENGDGEENYEDGEEEKEVKPQMQACRVANSVINPQTAVGMDSMEMMLAYGDKSLQDRVDDAIETWPLPEPILKVIGRTDGPLSSIVRSGYFVALSNLLIFSNVCFICVQAQHTVDQSLKGEGEDGVYALIDFLFSCYFAFELVIKIIGERVSLIVGPDWRWNFMDLCFVLSDVANHITILMAATSTDVGYLRNLRGGLRGIRMIRAARTVKIFRTMKFIYHIRLLTLAFVGSAPIALYTSVLFAIVLLFFAIVFMQAAAYGIDAEFGENGVAAMQTGYVAKLVEFFGTVGAAEKTLFKVVSGGMEWAELYECLQETSGVYGFIFLLFICYITIGCANVFVAVFVETIMAMSRRMDLDEKYQAGAEALKILRRLETVQEGSLSLEELKLHLESIQVQEQFGALGLDTFETVAICDIITDGGVKMVRMEDLAKMIVRYTRPVRSADFVPIQLANRRLKLEMENFSEKLDKRINAILQYLQQGFNTVLGSPQSPRGSAHMHNGV